MDTLSIMNPLVVDKYISDFYFCDLENEKNFLIKQIGNGHNVVLKMDSVYRIIDYFFAN